MKLYSFSPTPNNRKFEAFIKHFDLPDEIHSMGFKGQKNRSEAYLKMNPLGKAPVLADGDFHLWESNVSAWLDRCNSLKGFGATARKSQASIGTDDGCSCNFSN